MPKFYLISTLFFVSIACYGQQGTLDPLQMKSISEYNIQNWSTENGLNQNSINDLLQTREGYLMLATHGGLTRYDGVNFETYTIGNTPGLKSNRTFTLMETDSGTLWIGHREGGISILKDGNIQTPKALEDIANEFVQDFCEDLDGNVWIATTNGLFRYSGGQLDKYHLEEGLPGKVVSRLFLHKSGVVHFFSENGEDPASTHGFILDGKIKVVKKYTSPEQFNILDYNSKGELWIAYPNKIVVEKDGSVIKSLDLGNHDLGEIHKFLLDRDENIWLGSPQDIVLITKEEVQKAQNGPVTFN
ncbi:MAG: hypothetical protein KI791_02505, partial [Cyclobacteriaceae bacterium]|nr:hypothetical protein [Cyclobacteriaceae bacterium SS2]